MDKVVFWILGQVFHNCPVGLLYFFGLKHLVKPGKGFRSTRKNHCTTHWSVKPVYYSQKYISGFFVFFFQIWFNKFAQGHITGLITFPTNKGDGWDRPILCDEKVFQYGDAIAIVCANTEKQAKAAAEKVKVETKT